MHLDKLVFGVLDTSARIASPALAAKLRGFTVSWSRYGYRGLIIESRSVNQILDEALKLGYQYCFIQAYGHIISEDWHPTDSGHKDFYAALGDWLEAVDFFVTGHILDDRGEWYGLDERCLLVNLRDYEQLGRPAFGKPSREPIEMATPSGGADGSKPLWLEPSGQTEVRMPSRPGWNFIVASLEAGKAVYNFDEALANNTLYLCPEREAQAGSFAHYLDEGILSYSEGQPANGLADDHKRFLNLVARQVNNVRRGVFLWNIEPYSDVETPPPDFTPPLSALYSVASGFKPNMILQTHGFDHHTRVVFFDYSPDALRVKKLLHQEWDGEDYPSFVRYLFKRFPSSETFYHLWADITPENIDWADVNRYWQGEINRWGGERVIKNHWAAFRELRVEYVQCNLLTEQDSLFAQIERQANSAIWWSNAFFTIYSNWFYTIEERKRIYDGWIQGLAAKNPDLFLYGSDYNNVSVNLIKAEAYATLHSQFGGSHLNPHKPSEHEIRF